MIKLFATIVLGLLLFCAIASLVVAFRFGRKDRQTHESPRFSDEDFSSTTRVGSHRYQDSYASYKWWAFAVSGVCFLLFFVMSYFTMLYKQDPGEAVVLRSFTGEVIGDDVTSGIGFKAPWVSAIKFDIRNQRVEMYGGTRTNTEPGPDGTAIVAGMQGGANAALSTTVRYSIEPDKVEDIYREYRSETNLLEREIKPAVRDEVRNAAATYEPYTIKQNRVQLAQDAEALLQARWEKVGIIVEGVDFGEILLDPETENAITAVNVSRQEVETARNNLDASRIQAETLRVDAQAQADADQIIRCGATTEVVIETVAGKEVTSTKVVPKEGDECEERLNEQVLTAKWLDVLEALGVNGNVTIVVPNDPSGGLDLQPRIDLPVNDQSSE